MEAEKLTIATDVKEVRSLFDIRRQPNDWDGEGATLQEVARRVYKSLCDSGTVRLVQPASGKPISWEDLVRKADPGVPSSNDNEQTIRTGVVVDSSPGSIRASVYPGAQNVSGIPWGTTSGGVLSGFLQVLALADFPSKMQFGPHTTWSAWTDLLGSFRSLKHPFTDMVITDQYIMSKSDEYLQECLVPVLDSLRIRDQTTVPRISLITSSKRFGSHPSEASPDDVATEDLLRLQKLYPTAEWSTVYVDLFGLSTKRKEIARNVKEFLHGRYITTGAMQIQFDPGLDVLKHRMKNRLEVVNCDRAGMPMLKSGRISVDGSFEEEGRGAILGYLHGLRSFFAGILQPGNSVGVAGSIEKNRLVFKSVLDTHGEARRSEMRVAAETMASHYTDREDASFREIDPWAPEE